MNFRENIKEEQVAHVVWTLFHTAVPAIQDQPTHICNNIEQQQHSVSEPDMTTHEAHSVGRRCNRRSRGRVRRSRSRKNKTTRRRWQTLARKRGIQRWSSLVSAKSSRLAKTHGMRKFLGELCWKEFVIYATTHYRSAFIEAFTPSDGVLRCHGPLDGGVCPHRFCVDVRQLASADARQRCLAGKRLELLHIDHTFDVQHICDTWKQLGQHSPPRWDIGVDATQLCSRLFSMGSSHSHLTFRCAVPTGTAPGGPCHHVARPHYRHTLISSDLSVAHVGASDAEAPA